MEKFRFLKNLGILRVPEGYNHATSLTSFREQYHPKECRCHADITDEHFGNPHGTIISRKRRISVWKKAANPSLVLKPGDELEVSLFVQSKSELTTSEERLAFLKGKGSVFPNVQGAALLFKEMRSLLPKGCRYVFFDDIDHLPFGHSGHRLVVVYAMLDGHYSFSLGKFEHVWSGDKSVLVCFTLVS